MLGVHVSTRSVQALSAVCVTYKEVRSVNGLVVIGIGLGQVLDIVAVGRVGPADVS